MSRFSHWHGCGPDFDSYSAGMKRCSHLHINEVLCRLGPGDSDTEAAAKQWEKVFDVPRIQDKLLFTNGVVRFTAGEKGQFEGIVSITIAVEGDKKFNDILNRAREKGVCGDGFIHMLGVKWYFVHLQTGRSRL